MLRKTLAAAAAILATTCAAAAQAGPDVRFERLGTSADSMQIYLVRGAETLHIGALWDSLQVIDHGGSPAVRRAYRTEDDIIGPEHSVYIYRLPGLTPVSIADEGPAPQALEFRADSVVGWSTTDRRRRREVARALGPGVYDGTAFDLMVRAGDLREGYSVAVPAYVSEMDSVVTLRARVTGSERVQVEGGRMADSWVVQMDFAGLASTLWIDKQTRALSRQTMDLEAGITMLMDRLPVRSPDERETR